MTAPPALPTTAFAILGLLPPGEARTAYEVAQAAGELLAPIFWAPAMSAVYTELQRLESLGYVGHVLEDETPTRSRRVYTITAAGSEVLAAWVGSPDAERTVVKSPALLRVLFGAAADPRAAVEARIAQARDEMAELGSEPDASDRHQRIVRAAAVRMRAAEIETLEQVLDELG